MIAERHDLEPGFWCEYSPPKSRVAALVQQPSHNVDGYSLADAYMKDQRASRRALLRALEGQE